MELDDNLKHLMKDLGAAINDSLTDSEPISEAIANIKSAGYDVFLILEATIGFNRREDLTQDQEDIVEQNISTDFTPSDSQFFKSLRISLSSPETGTDSSSLI